MLERKINDSLRACGQAHYGNSRTISSLLDFSALSDCNKQSASWPACCMHIYTELDYMALPRFGEFCSCCCLPLLSQLVCSILATWERPHSQGLHCRIATTTDSTNRLTLTINGGSMPQRGPLSVCKGLSSISMSSGQPQESQRNPRTATSQK